MALKITVERVDDCQVGPSSHRPSTLANINDNLPIVVVVKDGTPGVTIKTVKALLNLAIYGKMGTVVTAATLSTQATIQAGHVEHVDALI